MEVESSTYTDFISCDRAGRRNAVHDIQRDATTISMRKLTEDLGDLAVEGAGELLQTPVSPAPGTQAGRVRHKMTAQLPLGASLGCSGGTSHSSVQSVPSHLVGTQLAGESPGGGALAVTRTVPVLLAHEHCTLQKDPLQGWFVDTLVLKPDMDPSRAFPGQTQVNLRLYKNEVWGRFAFLVFLVGWFWIFC